MIRYCWRCLSVPGSATKVTLDATDILCLRLDRKGRAHAKSTLYVREPINPRSSFQYKDRLSVYDYFNYKDTTVVESSYLFNGNAYTSKGLSYADGTGSPPIKHIWLESGNLKFDLSMIKIWIDVFCLWDEEMAFD